jgi:DHA2 family multidrug resistance protein-like MFS transporter
MSIIAENFKDKQKRAEAMGIWTSVIAGSVVIGPLVGGPLIDYFSWQSVFFINAPIGVFAFLMSLKLLPKDPHTPSNKWSISGATLTVTKEDDSTAAWTATVSTTAGADPVTGNDPT